MRFLLRLVFMLVAVLAGLSVIRGLLTSIFPARPLRQTSGSHLVQDPVCGTYIPEETALRAGDKCFCSEDCRQKYGKIEGRTPNS
jgi:YHS domain-containing protein